MALHTIVEHENAHIKPYVDAKISSEKQALSDEAEIRARLNVHNILPFDPTKPTSDSDTANYTYSYSDGAHVFTSTNQYYGRVRYNFSSLLIVGKKYKVSFTAKAIKGGENNLAVLLFNSSGNTYIKNWSTNDGTLTSDYQDFEYEFIAADTIVGLQFYLKYGNEAGENTLYIKNIQIAFADDAYNGFQPYAMTNQQLTTDKAEKSDLASINITGTTNSTGSTISTGTYFYLNGALVKAKTDIANGATLTANTNYTTISDGGLNNLRLKSETRSITFGTDGCKYSVLLPGIPLFAINLSTTNVFVQIGHNAEAYYLLKCTSSDGTPKAGTYDITIYYV